MGTRTTSSPPTIDVGVRQGGVERKLTSWGSSFLSNLENKDRKEESERAHNPTFQE